MKLFDGSQLLLWMRWHHLLGSGEIEFEEFADYYCEWCDTFLGSREIELEEFANYYYVLGDTFF